MTPEIGNFFVDLTATPIGSVRTFKLNKTANVDFKTHNSDRHTKHLAAGRWSVREAQVSTGKVKRWDLILVWIE